MSTQAFDRLSSDPGFKELFRVAKHRNYPKNHIILSESSTPDCLYILVSGLAAVRHSGNIVDDRELLLAYLYPGDFFGEMGLFPGVKTRSAMVKSSAPCVALEIGYLAFLDLTKKYPSLWLELAGQLAERLRNTNHRLAAMPALHAADRVWLALTEIASHSDTAPIPEGKPIRITRQDLGKLSGCSRELAGMVIKDFASQGRIVLRGKTIVVPHAAFTA